jgi:pSer/pThr/pTyr-binding forkhead associated (FHA) protein
MMEESKLNHHVRSFEMLDVLVDGSFIKVWYDWWIPVVGFGLALTLAIVVMGRSSVGRVGLVAKSIAVMAVLAALPLAIERLGLNLLLTDYNTVAYMNVIGSITAVVCGFPYLVGKGKEERRRRSMSSIVSQYPDPSTMADAVPSSSPQVTNEQVKSPRVADPSTSSLSIIKGSDKGQTVQLGHRLSEISLGRSADNNVVIDDPLVSRQHARIGYQNGQYVLVDSGSSNGTMVNGNKVQTEVLIPGAVIKVGDSELLYQGPAPKDYPQAVKVAGPGREAASDVIAAGKGGLPTKTIFGKRPVPIMAWLAIKAGPQAGKRFDLGIAGATIGRGSSNDIQLEDAVVSRNHAVFSFKNGKFTVLDAGSAGGTMVNGEKLIAGTLQGGGTLTVGNTSLTLVKVDRQTSAPANNATSVGTYVAPASGESEILVVQSGPDAGKVFPLREGNNSLGRDIGNEIHLDDPAVSRDHCVLRKDGDRVTVHDLASTSGTMVDGQTIRGHELTSNDTVTVGQTQMAFMHIAA